VVGAAVLFGAAAWQHSATAGIEDPPVCDEFAAGMVDEILGGVAGGPGTGMNFATGFEPEEGYPLGYISNTPGSHPVGCGGPAFPCWGHTTAATASLITPTIENLNPASGVQHMRLIHDPSTRTNQTGFGFGVGARYPRGADLSARPIAPSTTSADLAISNSGGMNFRFQPQSNSQGCIQGSALFFEDGEIYILDDFCGAVGLNFQPTGHFWDTTGAYRNFTYSNNPCTDTQNYYYNGQLIFSGCLIFGSNLEQLLVFGDNYPGSYMDVDNVVMESQDSCPCVCGNGIIESGCNEQCDGFGADANCPGRCQQDCTCAPICTFDNPCPVENGVNGPYLTSGGFYVYSGGSPFISVNGCGNSFDSAIQVQTVADVGTPIAFNDDCNNGPYGAGSDPSASCFDGASGNQYGSCTCFGNPNEPVLIWMPRYTGGAPILGSISVIEIRKKSACAGDSVGACCDTNGMDQGCTDNVTAANCVGADKVFTDQGKCEDVVCECIPDCTGATCGSDGCGGTCGTCGDGDVCNGTETCVDRNCAAGTPLICNDGNACNGLETCDPVLGCRPGTPLNCDDGLFCNGVESCATTAGCQPGEPPCAEDETCEEDADQCVPNAIPAVGEWGLLALALLLLILAKVRFARPGAAPGQGG
jgi:hypothetical protein